MRMNETSYQRALAQARKLTPAVRQVGNSTMFDVTSTSELDRFYHVQLSDNKYNLLSNATCECKGPKWTTCVHRVAALLQYVSTLEARLWKGCDYVTQLQDTGQPQFDIDEATELWLDLLTRYEMGTDLIRAIEAGQNISTFIGIPKKSVLTPDNEQEQLLSA